MTERKKPLSLRTYRAIGNVLGFAGLALAIYWTATNRGLYPLCRRFVDFLDMDGANALMAFTLTLALLMLPTVVLVVALAFFTEGAVDEFKKRLAKGGVRL